MLSVACHESSPPPPEEPAPAIFSFRRLAVAFEPKGQHNRKVRDKRAATPTIAVPAYSRIVYRAGTVSFR
jgi:hypothetical protein